MNMTNPAIRGYLFVPASKKQSLEKSEEIVFDSSAVRIIDLEDSIKDPSDPSISAELKKEARQVLRDYVTNDIAPFQIRINDLESPFWKDDLNLLSELKSRCDFQEKCQGIVLPKADSKEQIQKLISSLREIDIDVPILPIVETKNGIDNLKEMLDLREIKSVIFGHHDYFYDKGSFPIPRSELTSEAYRNALKSIAATVKEKRGDIELVDGVYSGLYDKEGLSNICRFLHQEYGEFKIGKLALNPFQAKVMESVTDLDREVQINSQDDEMSSEAKKELALELIDQYENRDTKTLGVGRAGENYLSPQQYYSSKAFIEEERNKELKQFKIK